MLLWVETPRVFSHRWGWSAARRLSQYPASHGDCLRGKTPPLLTPVRCKNISSVCVFIFCSCCRQSSCVCWCRLTSFSEYPFQDEHSCGGKTQGFRDTVLDHQRKRGSIRGFWFQTGNNSKRKKRHRNSLFNTKSNTHGFRPKRLIYTTSIPVATIDKNESY